MEAEPEEQVEAAPSGAGGAAESQPARGGDIVRAAKQADDRWEVEPNGSVRYNFKAENLVAHCTYHSGNCRRTRTVRPPNSLKNLGQGRPVGLLCAWLERARDYATAKEHSANCKPTFQERVDARQRFEADADAKAWADTYERAPGDGEQREPSDLM